MGRWFARPLPWHQQKSGYATATNDMNAAADRGMHAQTHLIFVAYIDTYIYIYSYTFV